MSERTLDLQPKYLNIVSAILAKHVSNYDVWAFGSRVTGKAKEYSDLDLAIISDKGLGISVLTKIANDFSDSDLPIKVDVLDWSDLDENFRKIIIQNKIIIQHGQN